MAAEPRRLAFACACLALIAAVALAPVVASAAGSEPTARGATAKKAFRPLTRRQIIALIKQYSSGGPSGSSGAQGPTGPQGAAGERGPEGKPGSDATIDGVAAGGALTGTYPDPTLAPGSVGSAAFAGGAVAPKATDAEALDGLLPAEWQRRLTGGCAGGQALTAIAEDGAPTCAATSGGAPGGPARGALSGSYPDPTLDVSGGDEGSTACKDGDAVTGLSGAAALSCGPGVYEDDESNLGVGGFRSDEGNENTAVGLDALLDNTTGDLNTASGQGALYSNTTGRENTAFGPYALFANTSGIKNIALGEGAGRYLTTGSGNIEIGNQGAAGEAETIRIGSAGAQQRAFLAGVFGVAPGGTTSQVVVDSAGQLGTTSSSRRFKRDIHPIGRQLNRLLELRPVSYRYRHDYVHGATPVQYGLIAEQVAKVFPNLVVDDGHGRPTAVAYQELPALLLAEARRQRHELRRQGAEIASLQRAVARLGAGKER